MQVLTGIWLAKGKSESKQQDRSGIQSLLLTFLLLNVLQILALVVLARLYGNRFGLGCVGDLTGRPTPISPGYTPVHGSQSPRGSLSSTEDQPLLTPLTLTSDDEPQSQSPEIKHRELCRGRIFACICVFLLCSCWLLFLGTAWSQLLSKSGESHVPQHNTT